MIATVCETLEEFELAGPGAVYWANDTSLFNKCPGCGRSAVLRIGGDVRPRWILESAEPLTLSPSVHSVGCCGWHGFLRGGEWVSC